MLQPISPKNVRFIKLGPGGAWEQPCIEEGTIRLGYEGNHQDSLAGNWEAVNKSWLDARNNNQGAATRDINQIRDFYELGEDDVWITFFQKKLYWCHAAKEVEELEDGTRIRKVIGHWHSTDINDQPLWTDNIDGRVTQVQGFRGTICTINQQDYLIKKINGQTIADVENAKASLEKLKADVESLIKGLNWQDFELLIDLVFSKAGWQRFSSLGKTQKDMDLDVYSPTTQKRAFVQVKSRTNRAELEAYIRTFQEYKQFDEMYFIYHTGGSDLSDTASLAANIHVWDLKRVSALVVNSGLTEWLINKRS